MNQRDWYEQQEAEGFTWLCRMVKRVTLGVGAAIMACTLPTALPAPELPQTTTVVGIGSHGSPNESAIIAGMGLQHVRVTYYLANDSEHARQLFGQRVKDLEAHHLIVLTVVHDFGRDTVQQMVSLARSFPGMTWQVLNEADAGGYTGTQYASLMKRLVPAVRSVDSTAQIVGMGLATVDATLSRFTREYLRAGGPVLRAWSIHAYGLTLTRSITLRVATARAELNGSMPIWVTEVGADAAGIRAAWRLNGKLAWTTATLDSVQAAQTLGAITAARSGNVERIYFYQLWDNTDTGFGFLRADAKTERPVVKAVRGAR